MSKVILLTGTSSGIGEETALYFADQGWNVVATMRNPDNRETKLHNRDDITLLHLDVLDPDSIKKAIETTVQKFDHIDVLVNNAGYALRGTFEATPVEKIRQQFDTNVIGLMEVCREILPTFREQKQGMIINVASVAGRTTYPLYSLYNSTKWAVEGFSESLHYELRPMNIKVKIIEPGIIKTDFYSRSMDTITKEGLTDYDDFIKRVDAKMGNTDAGGSPPIVIAKTIFKAANDSSFRLRYASGKGANLVFFMRKLLPDSLFFSLIRANTIE